MIIIKNINGINEEELDKLIIDIYNRGESIHKCFDNINNYMENINDYVDSDVIDELKNKYNNYRINLKKVYDMVIKCADELNDVKYKYNDLNVEISDNLIKNKDNIGDEFYE